MQEKEADDSLDKNGTRESPVYQEKLQLQEDQQNTDFYFAMRIKQRRYIRSNETTHL